jgi:hypothetical protein
VLVNLRQPDIASLHYFECHELRKIRSIANMEYKRKENSNEWFMSLPSSNTIRNQLILASALSPRQYSVAIVAYVVNTIVRCWSRCLSACRAEPRCLWNEIAPGYVCLFELLSCRLTISSVNRDILANFVDPAVNQDLG